MAFNVMSAAFLGINAQIIELETEISYGMPCFTIVGLADKSVEESKERISSAIKNSGFKPPYSQPQRITVNLAPADIKKEGTLYDLPIALGYLLASKQTIFNQKSRIFAGELSLNGKIRTVKGVLSLALAAKENNIEEIILPKQNAIEASIIAKDNKPKIIGVESLKETINFLEGKIDIPTTTENQSYFKSPDYCDELAFIKGQESAKRALVVAAAGGHNLLMQGPPGAGKTILAKSLPSILPPLSFEESIEVTKIHSIAGELPKNQPIINYRPFRSPHHTASESALIGGGNPIRPGEITLAHRGVLFLDELPEFHRDVLESLRQPLEEGIINILRSKNKAIFPARFILVAAANPCPCGYYNDPDIECKCQSSQIAKYRRKLSGPLIDRIDIFIEVPKIKFEKLKTPEEQGYAAKLKEKVKVSRLKQSQRFEKQSVKKTTNAEMSLAEIKKYCQIDDKSESILKKYVDSGKISIRGYYRILKVARTIADLENSEKIKYQHLTEALMYRIRTT